METGKKLKIAYVIPRFYPFKGGTEVNCYSLAVRMVKLGHEVTVITTDVKYRNETLAREEVIDGIKIVRIHAFSESLYAGFYPGLLSYLLKHNFDLIHAHGIGFIWREFCLILTKIVKARKTKFIVTPHGPFMALNDKEGLRGIAKKYGTILLRTYLNWLYDSMVQVTPNQKEWMYSEYRYNPDKVHLVPNGIDESIIEKRLFVHEAEEKVVITFIGRMEYYKGIQELIAATYLLKRNAKYKKENENGRLMADFEVKIMGRAGNYTEKLKDQIEKLKAEDYVELVFSPSDEERDRILYEESQINVLPSKWEATGIVLLEAMGKGNAVISTRQNQAVDLIIEEGVNGNSYNFGDEDVLADILYNMLSNFDLRQSMRKENLKRAKNFTWEGVMPMYLKLIEKLTSNKISI